MSMLRQEAGIHPNQHRAIHQEQFAVPCGGTRRAVPPYAGYAGCAGYAGYTVLCESRSITTNRQRTNANSFFIEDDDAALLQRVCYRSLFTLSAVHTPIDWQHTQTDVAVERGIRPIHQSPHQPMLHGIPMYVIDVPAKIGFIPNQVLPISPLPSRVRLLSSGFCHVAHLLVTVAKIPP